MTDNTKQWITTGVVVISLAVIMAVCAAVTISKYGI